MDISEDRRVATIFNAMQADYDDLRDLWYSWLFSRLHYFIAEDIVEKWNTGHRKVLDVGCGTGFQSLLYASLGADVLGVDIADHLIEKARKKEVRDVNDPEILLFPQYYEFGRRYHAKTWKLLREKFPRVTVIGHPQFEVASALALPVANSSIDHVNCCGSVLSFISDVNLAIKEISRVLKPGGTFFMELEGRWNPDTFWVLIDCLFSGKLGYDCSFREAIELIKPPLCTGVITEYPFGENSNPIYMPLNLTTRNEMNRKLRNSALSPTRWRFIHAFTNLIPSTLLDNSFPSDSLIKIFSLLSRIEESIPGYWPGCSIVVCGHKDS